MDNSPAGGFVAKINAFGTGLVYSTGLPGVAGVSAIAVDGLHRAHIAGKAAVFSHVRPYASSFRV